MIHKPSIVSTSVFRGGGASVGVPARVWRGKCRPSLLLSDEGHSTQEPPWMPPIRTKPHSSMWDHICPDVLPSIAVQRECVPRSHPRTRRRLAGRAHCNTNGVSTRCSTSFIEIERICSIQPVLREGWWELFNCLYSSRHKVW